MPNPTPATRTAHDKPRKKRRMIFSRLEVQSIQNGVFKISTRAKRSPSSNGCRKPHPWIAGDQWTNGHSQNKKFFNGFRLATPWMSQRTRSYRISWRFRRLTANGRGLVPMVADDVLRKEQIESPVEGDT